MRIISFFILLFLFQSCLVNKAVEVPQMRKSITVEAGSIPPEFSVQKTTLLLISKQRSSYDNYLKRAFKKHYKGEYEFVNISSLPTKYKDKEKYRYYISYVLGSTQTYTNGKSEMTSHSKKFYIFDRLTGEKYFNPKSFNFFGKALKFYAIKLEEHRFKE